MMTPTREEMEANHARIVALEAEINAEALRRYKAGEGQPVQYGPLAVGTFAGLLRQIALPRVAAFERETGGRLEWRVRPGWNDDARFVTGYFTTAAQLAEIAKYAP